MPVMAVLWLVAASVAAHADAASGRAAYERGDYAQAMAEWQAAADKKDPEAEFGLGNLYEFGAGDLSQDYRRAAYWYRKAARRGDVAAEYRLSLLHAAGGDNFPADFAEAEKWADLAAPSHGVWGTLASRFKTLLDAAATPEQRAAGEQRAAAWTKALAAPKPEAPAATPAPMAAVPAGKPGGCPGWPFPTLPCTEQFPALSGMHGPPQPSASASPPQVVAVVPAPKAPAAKPPLVGLNDALARVDCAALHGRTAADGSAIVTGSVPDAEQKNKLLQLAAEYFPSGRNEIAVDIVPPPVCHSLVTLEQLQRSGATAGNALGLRLESGGNRLREGDPIALEVRAPDYPVEVRIDYFSLDGRVLHFEPDPGQAPPEVAAGATRLFGTAATGQDWRAGGAPFGTELIAAVATPVPLNLGERPRVEEAAAYLDVLKQAVDKIDATSGRPALIARLPVKTSGR